MEKYVHEPSTRAQERGRRRRHLRHGVVLVLVTVLLAVAAFSGWMVLSRQWVIPGLDPEPRPVVDASCPQEKFSYAESNTVTVNVYNATTKAGLASTVASQLRDRGFKIGAVGNRRLGYNAEYGVVISGGLGRSEALSVQRNAAGLLYVTDTRRTDHTVDVVLGARFKSLTDLSKVRQRNGTLNCLPEPASSATPTPTTTTSPTPVPVSPSPSKK